MYLTKPHRITPLAMFVLIAVAAVAQQPEQPGCGFPQHAAADPCYPPIPQPSARPPIDRSAIASSTSRNFVRVMPANALAGTGQEPARRHPAKMSYLDNGVIRLGVDLNLGGAVTYLSRSCTEQNLVNSYDFGRQIQMSYYSGPVPFAIAGRQPKPEWSFIGWNPIQVGDAFGNASKLLEHSNDCKQVYVKCIPLHWPLDNVAGECT